MFSPAYSSLVFADDLACAGGNSISTKTYSDCDSDSRDITPASVSDIFEKPTIRQSSTGETVIMSRSYRLPGAEKLAIPVLVTSMQNDTKPIQKPCFLQGPSLNSDSGLDQSKPRFIPTDHETGCEMTDVMSGKPQDQSGRICQLLLNLEDRILGMQNQLADVQSKQGRMEQHLLGIQDQLSDVQRKQAVANQGPGHEQDSGSAPSADAGRDRKRLKERLKKAVLSGATASQTVGWLEYAFGICAGDRRMGKNGSRLIHPLSPFMQGEVLVCGLLLLYTAIVAPVQICMWAYDDPCNRFPTLEFDVFVDSFFLAEILLQFFVGFLREDQVYIDSPALVARAYLESPLRFWFDAATSIPFSILDFVVYQNSCVSSGAVSDTSSLGETRLLRVVKIFRLLKMLRLLKLIKFLSIVQDYATVMLGQNFFKIFRLLSIVLFAVHFFACAFWRVASTSRSPEELDALLSSKNVPPDDLSKIYMMCFYFVFTVFTTVGFGDIYATNVAEQVFCVIVFLTAVSLFGTLISQLNEIVIANTSLTKSLDESLNLYLGIDPRLDSSMIIEIWNWERFNYARHAEKKHHLAVLEKQLPETWRLAIAKKIENNILAKIPFLASLGDSMGEIRTLFSAELLMKSETRYFPAGAIIADSRENANGIFVVTSGQVAAELPMDSEEADEEKQKSGAAANTILYVFGRGESIGSSSVAGDYRWAGCYGVVADFIAISHCSVEFIPLDAIVAVLEKFEYLPIKCHVMAGRQTFLKFGEELAQNDFWKHALKSKTIFLWTLIARQIAMRLPQAQPSKKLADTTDSEVSNSNSIKLSTEQLEMIREVFDLFDTDGQQQLDEEELACALSAMGFSQTGHVEMAKRMIDQVDNDNSRTINLEEFTSIMQGQLVGNNMEDDIYDTFAVFCSASINLQQLQLMSQDLELNLDNKELEEMIRNADRSGSCQSVSQEEYFQIVKNSTWV